MVEYFVDGHAFQSSSWKRGRFSYEPGQTIQLRQCGLYDLGSSVNFAADGDSGEYTTTGWSYQEPLYRWTEGSAAALRFVIRSAITNDLLLRLRGFGFVIDDDDANYQSVDVFSTVRRWHDGECSVTDGTRPLFRGRLWPMV